MGALSNHPREGQVRSLHFDVDASTPDDLLDALWAFTGPGAQLMGTPIPDGAFVDPDRPTDQSLQDRSGSHASGPPSPRRPRPVRRGDPPYGPGHTRAPRP